MSNESLSRRNVLQLMAASGVGLAAAACTDTSGAKSGNEGPLKKGKFDIPNSGAKLPSGQVKLRWVDSGDTKALFFKAFFPDYQKKHSNVDVSYDGSSWNNIQQVISTGVRNGTAPDVFQMPPQITVPQAVNNKWIMPVNDMIPNWTEVKKKFPVGAFANGGTDFGGKTYGMPFSGTTRIGWMTMFNKDITTKTDYDLDNKVLSWDDLRAVAKQATKQGKGKYYGVIFGMGQQGGLAGPVSTLAEMAGVHGGADPGNGIGGGINWQNGEFNFTNDITIEAIELILAMKSDGSVFPGSVSLDQPGARGRMPQGVAAIIFQGAWNIPQWKSENPSFNLGINLPPQRDPKNIWPLSHGPGGSDTWYVSSNTKAAAVIGDIFYYMSTLNGQTQWANYNGAGDPPQFPNAIKQASLDGLEKKAYQQAVQYTMLGPAPAVRNLDVSDVFLANVPVEPNFDATLVGLFTGQIKKSVKAAMKDLDNRSNKGLDAAIAAAKKKGAKVDRQDWVFSDWNPKKPYTKLYHA